MAKSGRNGSGWPAGWRPVPCRRPLGVSGNEDARRCRTLPPVQAYPAGSTRISTAGAVGRRGIGRPRAQRRPAPSRRHHSSFPKSRGFFCTSIRRVWYRQHRVCTPQIRTANLPRSSARMSGNMRQRRRRFRPAFASSRRRPLRTRHG